MERRVKERMVGAAILVAIVVLVVPELLSGPAPRASGGKSSVLPAGAPEPMRTVRVDLNGNTETAAETAAGYAHASAAGGAPTPAASAPAAAALATAATQPVPGAVTAPASAAVTAPASAAVATPASAAVAAAAAKAPAPRVARGAWTVQLGSFESRANAEKLMKHWKANGYAAYVSSVGTGSSRRHRVRVGPYSDRAAALKAVARLKATRQAASIVAPGH